MRIGAARIAAGVGARLVGPGAARRNRNRHRRTTQQNDSTEKDLFDVLHSGPAFRLEDVSYLSDSRTSRQADQAELCAHPRGRGRVCALLCVFALRFVINPNETSL